MVLTVEDAAKKIGPQHFRAYGAGSAAARRALLLDLVLAASALEEGAAVYPTGNAFWVCGSRWADAFLLEENFEAFADRPCIPAGGRSWGLTAYVLCARRGTAAWRQRMEGLALELYASHHQMRTFLMLPKKFLFFWTRVDVAGPLPGLF